MMSVPVPSAEVRIEGSAFSAVPAGLAQITIAAPDFPVASRVAPVDADIDAEHPKITSFDFRLSLDDTLDAPPNGEKPLLVGPVFVVALLDRHPNPPSDELFGPDFDRRPIDGEQSPKQFGTFDSFGFSMGGLVARTYQLLSLYLDPPPREIVDGELQGRRTGRLAHMVSMGTPHHGALQFTRLVVSPTASAVSGIPLEQLLRRWSPGTADLLDYSDSPVRREECEDSGNPVLCDLNVDSGSAPIVETSLIAGTKSTQRLAIDIDLDLALNLEVLTVSGVESDSIVPVSSAHGESTLARRLVPALRKRRTFKADFDHLHVGTDATAQGEGNQRISLFADRAILPTLRNHWVIRERGLVADEPIAGPGLVIDDCPTPTEPGRIRADFSFDWKATRGDLAGLALVTYVEDETGQWSILHGADPETGELDSELLLLFEGNSISIPRENTRERQIRFDDALPPGIDARRMTTLFVTTGARRPTTAPLQPSPKTIERAEIRGRVLSCR